MTRQQSLERRKELFEKYQQGSSYAQLAREYNMHITSVINGIQIYTDLITDYSRL